MFLHWYNSFYILYDSGAVILPQTPYVWINLETYIWFNLRGLGSFSPTGFIYPGCKIYLIKSPHSNPIIYTLDKSKSIKISKEFGHYMGMFNNGYGEMYDSKYFYILFEKAYLIFDSESLERWPLKSEGQPLQSQRDWALLLWRARFCILFQKFWKL